MFCEYQSISPITAGFNILCKDYKACQKDQFCSEADVNICLHENLIKIRNLHTCFQNMPIAEAKLVSPQTLWHIWKQGPQMENN